MGGWRYGTGRARTGYSPYWYLPRTALPPPLRPQPEIQVLPHCFSFIVSPYGSAYLYLLQLHAQLPFIHHNNQSSLIPKQTRTKRKEKRSYDLDSMVLQYVVLLCSSSRGGYSGGEAFDLFLAKACPTWLQFPRRLVFGDTKYLVQAVKI